MNLNNELTNKIAALERILFREREARKEAESQLEHYTSNLYEQELQNTQNRLEVENKQSQLEFLTGLLAETWRQPTLKQIVTNYLERASNFMFKTTCLFIELHQDLSFHHCQYHFTSEEGELEKEARLVTLKQFIDALDRAKIFNELSSTQESNLYHTNEVCNQHHPLFCHCVMMPLYYSSDGHDNAIGVAILLYKQADDININKLQTLESSRSMLSVAIARRKNEETLQSKLIEVEQINSVLEQTQQQLIEQEKLASLGLLAAGVAHEINNPVGFVLSNLDMMRDYLQDMHTTLEPISNTTLSLEQKVDTINSHYKSLDIQFLFEDSDSILKSSVEGLERVKEIVSDLSTFSRMDNDELEPIDLTIVIQKSLNMVNNELKYKHTTDVNLLPHASILGSEGQLQQVFVNLFVNAKHAMKDGGCLSITSFKEKNKIMVSIKDQGCGIKQEHLKNIFTPFFTTKAPGEGTGLGLSISYSILQQHNAKVTVNSQLNVGTEFLLSFHEYQ